MTVLVKDVRPIFGHVRPPPPWAIYRAQKSLLSVRFPTRNQIETWCDTSDTQTRPPIKTYTPPGTALATPSRTRSTEQMIRARVAPSGGARAPPPPESGRGLGAASLNCSPT